LQAQPRHEAVRVEGRTYLDVVVEIAINVASAASRRAAGDALRVGGLAAELPAAYAIGPAIQRRIGVAAGIELLVAVQPQVQEVRGDVFEVGPLAGGIRHHQRDAMAAQLRDEFSGGETGMTNFDGVPQPTIRVDAQRGAPVHAGITPPRKL